MYNPLKWTSNQRVAFAIFVIVGALIGPVIGFMAVGGGHSFYFWAWDATDSFTEHTLRWSVFGAMITGLTGYAQVLLRL
jgi:hypothetical protein